jgi:hypothetical protein
VSKKSIAIFAGFCVVKSAGFCANGPCRSTVNTVCSPSTLASICLTWLFCASAAGEASTSTIVAAPASALTHRAVIMPMPPASGWSFSLPL